jgi:hypothetical protein
LYGINQVFRKGADSALPRRVSGQRAHIYSVQEFSQIGEGGKVFRSSQFKSSLPEPKVSVKGNKGEAGLKTRILKSFEGNLPKTILPP